MVNELSPTSSIKETYVTDAVDTLRKFDTTASSDKRIVLVWRENEGHFSPVIEKKPHIFQRILDYIFHKETRWSSVSKFFKNIVKEHPSDISAENVYLISRKFGFKEVSPLPIVCLGENVINVSEAFVNSSEFLRHSEGTKRINDFSRTVMHLDGYITTGHWPSSLSAGTLSDISRCADNLKMPVDIQRSIYKELRKKEAAFQGEPIPDQFLKAFFDYHTKASEAISSKFLEENENVFTQLLQKNEYIPMFVPMIKNGVLTEKLIRELENKFPQEGFAQVIQELTNPEVRFENKNFTKIFKLFNNCIKTGKLSFDNLVKFYDLLDLNKHQNSGFFTDENALFSSIMRWIEINRPTTNDVETLMLRINPRYLNDENKRTFALLGKISDKPPQRLNFSISATEFKCNFSTRGLSLQTNWKTDQTGEPFPNRIINFPRVRFASQDSEGSIDFCGSLGYKTGSYAFMQVDENVRAGSKAGKAPILNKYKYEPKAVESNENKILARSNSEHLKKDHVLVKSNEENDVHVNLKTGEVSYTFKLPDGYNFLTEYV